MCLYDSSPHTPYNIMRKCISFREQLENNWVRSIITYKSNRIRKNHRKQRQSIDKKFGNVELTDSRAPILCLKQYYKIS